MTEPERGTGGKKGMSALTKVAAIVGAAFLSGIGGYIATRATGSVEELVASAPLSVRVIPGGEYTPAHVYAPFYVYPSDGPRPEDLVADSIDWRTWGDWSTRHGAVHGSPRIVRLELRGAGDEPVVIHDVRVRVLARRPPVEGWFAASGGCGAETIRMASVDLDASPPTVEYFDEDYMRVTRPVALSVHRGDVEVLELHAYTRTSDVDWVADISYSAAQKSGSVTVTDGGQPFRVTSETASRGYSILFYEEGAELERRTLWDDGIRMC